MYVRIQVINKETRVAVCALVANTNTVTNNTMQQWAEALVQLADKAAGAQGTHTTQQAETMGMAAAALARLAGTTTGGGNHGTKDKGRCPVCGRVYSLSSKTGKLVKHGKQYRINGIQSPRAAHCPGSGATPKAIV